MMLESSKDSANLAASFDRVKPTLRMGPVSETDRVFELIKEWIITAILPPGDFLSEPDLAERCQTSRTPVREALSRLAQDRWIVNIRRKGYLISPISVRDIAELYEFRSVLEAYTAGKAAQSIGAAQIAELREILKPETEAGDDLAPILRANEKFHLKLAEFAGNQRIYSQLQLALGFVRRLDTLCTQAVPGWIGHENLLEAIAAHRVPEANRAMAEHIQASRDKMIHLFSK
jgi:GntR family transcriptional regulator, rspAB operon transcriptional repressor